MLENRLRCEQVGAAGAFGSSPALGGRAWDDDSAATRSGIRPTEVVSLGPAPSAQMDKAELVPMLIKIKPSVTDVSACAP